MAKSARSSQRKRNSANLRATVFGPAHDARTERLSAKLLELANAPKPEQEEKAAGDEDKKEEDPNAVVDHDAQDEAMHWTGIATSNRKSKVAKASARSGRVAKRKAKNQVVFPSEIARKKRQAKAKKG